MKFRGLGKVLASLVAAGVASMLAGGAYAETVLITGANSGIGLEFTKQYAAKGWTVIATHRRKDMPKTLAEVVAKYPKVRVETLDVTSVESVATLASRLGGTPVDVLINNAGVYNDRRKCPAEEESCPGDWTNQGFGKMDFTLLDTILDVNVKGPLIVTQGLYENVKKSGLRKIIAVSSSNGTLTGEKPPRPGAVFYRTSKAALNRSMQIVAASVKQDGVTVIMFNPGPTSTERQSYIKSPIMIKTDFTVGNMIRTIDKVTIEDTGKFLRYDGEPEPW